MHYLMNLDRAVSPPEGGPLLVRFTIGARASIDSDECVLDRALAHSILVLRPSMSRTMHDAAPEVLIGQMRFAGSAGFGSRTE